MNFTQSFRLALKSLTTSKMRALLTMLGIIIGVAAVIVITSLGNGMQNMMNEQFEKLGANLIQVQIMGRGSGGSRTVTPDDMYALAEKYPQYIADVSPYVGTQAVIRQGTDEYKRTSIYGVSEAFFDPERRQAMSGETLAEGRFLQYIDVERYQNVCLIGSYLNETAFRGDGLGKTLTIGGNPYVVVGVLAEQADSEEGSGDDVLFLPYGNALRLNSASAATMYLFNSTSKDTAAIAKGLIENRLFQTFQSSDYYFVMTSAEMMDSMNLMMGTMMTVLVAIAAISLLVGGIGIMNIMLVTVTERTREIGIRKAIGAERRSIITQFLIEAAMICGIGGVFGIIVGYLGTMIVGKLSFETILIPSAGITVGAFFISVALGILFGMYPAIKASALQPVEALRAE